MIQAYSNNIEVAANEAIPFNSNQTFKGCTVCHNSAASFELNKAGIYLIDFSATAAAAATVQLFVNGVAQAAAQATGTSISFPHTVVVPNNNSRCDPCSSPVTIQVINTGETAATFDVANIVITKIA